MRSCGCFMSLSANGSKDDVPNLTYKRGVQGLGEEDGTAILVDQGENNNVKHLFRLRSYCVLTTIPPYHATGADCARMVIGAGNRRPSTCLN